MACFTWLWALRAPNAHGRRPVPLLSVEPCRTRSGWGQAQGGPRDKGAARRDCRYGDHLHLERSCIVPGRENDSDAPGCLARPLLYEYGSNGTEAFRYGVTYCGERECYL